MASDAVLHQHNSFDADNFYLVDGTNNTKVAKFVCSSITAGQTSTITIPDSDFTLGNASSIEADNITAGDAAVTISTTSGSVTIDSNASSVTVDGHTGIT